jgi:hypothetical protein
VKATLNDYMQNSEQVDLFLNQIGTIAQGITNLNISVQALPAILSHIVGLNDCSPTIGENTTGARRRQSHSDPSSDSDEEEEDAGPSSRRARLCTDLTVIPTLFCFFAPGV